MLPGTILFLVTILLCVACGSGNESSNATIQYPDADSQAARLYVKICGQCHAAPLPTIHDASVWPGVLQRMQMHMVQKSITPPDKNQLGIILTYLQSNAKK
jgi:cytochrome c5